MTVIALDHFNIITPDLDGTAQFYADVLDLERRDAPLPRGPDMMQWMYDSAGRAIVHINSVDCPRVYDRAVASGPTGAIHHIALGCQGFDRMTARLEARGIRFTVNLVPTSNLRQIFLHDPNDILLELNFIGE